MARSKPYMLLDSGMIVKAIGAIVSHSAPITFWGIDTDNVLHNLGTVIDGNIDFPVSSAKIIVIYYTFEHLTPGRASIILSTGSTVQL